MTSDNLRQARLDAYMQALIIQGWNLNTAIEMAVKAADMVDDQLELEESPTDISDGKFLEDFKEGT